MKSALTIAGSDPSGGAGIQQDLRVFSDFRLWGASALTAVTAQNTKGVSGVHVLPLEVISGQIDAVFGDITPSAVKTGMLGAKNVVRLVRKKMVEYGVSNLVVDPILRSTSGHVLLEDDAVSELKKLLSTARLSTPNICEAEVLSGVEIRDVDDMVEAARRIGDCVVTGGHLDGKIISDVLCFGGRISVFRTRRINASFHGTGCAFSAAVCAGLAGGKDVFGAVDGAVKYIRKATLSSVKIGCGMRLLGCGIKTK